MPGRRRRRLPQDARRIAAYVRTLLARYPSIRDVVVWNEPNKSLFWSPQLAADGTPVAAARYQELLARCYDVLHGSLPNVNVIGLALSSTGNDNAGSASPGAFIRDVGAAYRASGRPAPLLDTVAYHPYGLDAAERPWRKHIASKTIALGDWNKLMYNLFLAFGGTSQPIPGDAGVRIWYAESASQTAIDPNKASDYTGTENVRTVPDYAGGEPDAPAPAETTSAPDQWTQALDAIRLAACQPHVTAYFNFLLADEPRLAGWQSGAYWADLTPKDSAPAFRQAISEGTSGAVACDELKGGRPSSDFMPPTTPTNLQGAGATDPFRVELTWSAAADASALSYRVSRDGAHVATTEATSWTNTNVAADTTYTYAVRAIDAAGNLGDASHTVTLTTPPAPAESTARPWRRRGRRKRAAARSGDRALDEPGGARRRRFGRPARNRFERRCGRQRDRRRRDDRAACRSDAARTARLRARSRVHRDDDAHLPARLPSERPCHTAALVVLPPPPPERSPQRSPPRSSSST